jgi:hypothetical protein
MEPLKISCKCITNARVNTLEESIHSFLIQEYEGERELIIVNDCKFQILKFDHPLVKIYNITTPFQNLGKKENFAIDKCKHPTIAVWDDDDIALPNHLSNINKWFKNCDLLRWNRGAYVNDNKIKNITHLGNSGIVYTKQIWEDVGRHENMNYGYDMAFTDKIQNHGGRLVLAKPPDSEVSWFYMWGNRSFHLSGVSENKENVLETYRQHTINEVKSGKIPAGMVYLKPKWNDNYLNILHDHIKSQYK